MTGKAETGGAPEEPAAHQASWPDMEPLLRQLSDDPTSVKAFRQFLGDRNAEIAERFSGGMSVEVLVRDRARLVDRVLLEAWRRFVRPRDSELALVAVGGYGRGELHPASDIDVMILVPEGVDRPWESRLEALVAFLWDIGLEVGLSVRTPAECIEQAGADVTVATTLMESRRLAGPRELFDALRDATGSDRIWSSRAFFEAKREEQIARHHRYHDTAYNLEPNVKGSPGGLRDIQMVGWVAKRHFGADTLDQLVDHGFLTEHELTRLKEGQAFLWTVRFALHVLTRRREDRLLFDHQTKIAQLLGYEDGPNTLAVEQFMQRYYRTVMELSRLNEMLLQLFEEAILLDPAATPVPLNERFQVRNGFLEITRPNVFYRDPSAILEMFLMLQQHPEFKGCSAKTIRLLFTNLDLINEEFRQSPRNHRLFREIIRAPQGVTHELRRMNRYGVLGRYIPAFERIVGRMQYDLFHAYTVDAHTLFVLSNLRRFALPRYDHEFPFCSRIMQSLPKPELAYLAGLFHDIGKGRGGDHSELGAAIAEAFCLEQGLSRYDARVVAWLVRHHLLLSTTAQKKDISDPKVIHDFALLVGDQTHLDYLYVLTVADVRGTNPKLWNSWKNSLFRDFYLITRQALRRGLENPVDKEELVADTQREAHALLAREGIEEERIEGLWSALSENYFLSHSAEEIAWHTAILANREITGQEALVEVRQTAGRGGTSVLVYSPEHWYTFARITAAMDEMNLSILDARIAPAGNDYSLDTYVVLEDTGAIIDDPERVEEIHRAVNRALALPADKPPAVRRPPPRQARMFSTPTNMVFSVDETNGRTVIELITGDRPGLLSEIGKAFIECGVRLHTAKIVTVGERAEDVFFVTDQQGRLLSEAGCERLRARLISALDEPAPAA